MEHHIEQGFIFVLIDMSSSGLLCCPVVLGDIITALSSNIFSDVGLDVEVQKEDEKQGTMEEDDIAVLFGKITVNENGKRCMDEEGGKLDQLHRC